MLVHRLLLPNRQPALAAEAAPELLSGAAVVLRAERKIAYLVHARHATSGCRTGPGARGSNRPRSGPAPEGTGPDPYLRRMITLTRMVEVTKIVGRSRRWFCIACFSRTANTPWRDRRRRSDSPAPLLF